MNLQLENKTALVTGSTKGLGFAIARLLAVEGAKVIINGRTEASARAAAAKIGDRARSVAADVSTATGCAALVEQVPNVDILVNTPAFSSRSRSRKFPMATGNAFTR